MRYNKSLIVYIVLGLMGAWLSYLALQAHFAHFIAPDSGPAICGISAKLNCKAAIESSYSMFLGFPIASYGFLFYSGLVFFSCLALLLRVISAALITNIVLVTAILACLYSLFLLYISVFQLDALCPICLMTYLVNFAMLLVAWWSQKQNPFFSRMRSGIADLACTPLRFFTNLNPSKGFLPIANALIGLAGVLALIVLALALPIIASQSVIAKASLSEAQLPWPKSDSKLPVTLQLDGSAWGDHYVGRLDAPIQLVEFFDYECPACRDFFHTLRSLLMEYPDKILLVFKNYPLDASCNPLIQAGHKNSCFAANLARCAAEQGHFHEASSYLLSLPINDGMSADEINAAMLKVAEVYKLDQAALQDCVSSGRQLKFIERDIEQGNTLELIGTPSMWINGRKAPRSLDPDTLRIIFNNILGES